MRFKKNSKGPFLVQHLIFYKKCRKSFDVRSTNDNSCGTEEKMENYSSKDLPLKMKSSSLESLLRSQLFRVRSKRSRPILTKQQNRALTNMNTKNQLNFTWGLAKFPSSLRWYTWRVTKHI